MTSLTPARQPGESYAGYRERRYRAERTVKSYLRGQWVYQHSTTGPRRPYVKSKSTPMVFDEANEVPK